LSARLPTVAGSRRRKPATAGIRRSIAVRTFSDWGDPPPGYFEADLVAHSGPSARGSFIQTLVLTDIATGWTECAPLLYREQNLLIETLNEMRKRLPFPLMGFDTDNDSVFINETVRDFCKEAGVEFTRCRPYRKNDQAWVEQKIGAVVRRVVGYRRFEGPNAAAALAKLYASLRLFVNFFQPSFKLAKKVRDGARVRKLYHPPATPCQRAIANPRTPQDVRQELERLSPSLDPVKLLSQIRLEQSRLVEIADAPQSPSELEPPSLDQFLSSLKTAWQAGEARPTAHPKAKAPRGRRRPDPLAAVTGELRGLFEAEPWLTARELLEKLQAKEPGAHPDGLLRTVQRRLKVWRREQAHSVVFQSASSFEEQADAPRGLEPPDGQAPR
jgi:hypothetical protein